MNGRAEEGPTAAAPETPAGVLTREPQRRIVLIGASNVARGISTILETARRVWGRPVEVFAAYGHGRSYGKPSRVIFRDLSGILECGLWNALAAREAQSTRGAPPCAALVTDIGNDLVYGRSAEQIADWVDACLARLAALGARTLVTRLPVANLNDLPEWRFLLLRKIFFPECRLPLATIASGARELDARLPALAARHGATIAAQQRAWYGWDPIHIKFKQMPRAWSEILAHWSGDRERPALARSAPGRAIYLRSCFPERRRLFGIEQRTTQPAGKLRDGSTLWLY